MIGHHSGSSSGRPPWARNTVAAITAILASRAVVEQSFRSCLGVMSLAKNPAASPDWKTPAPGRWRRHRRRPTR